MITKNAEDQVTQALTGKHPSLPEPKARAKAASLSGGFKVVGVGFVLLVFGVVALKITGGLAGGIIGVSIAGCGCLFMVAGGNKISGEALSTAAEKVGGLLGAVAKVIAAARGKA